jgi:iron complex transport system substrate-binding protein
MEPDFILSWYSFFGEKRLGEVDFWHSLGIDTYMMLNSGGVTPRTLENEYTDILNLGRISIVEQRANALVSEVQRVRSAVRGKPAKRVLLIEFLGRRISRYGANRLGGDMPMKIGATVLFPQGGTIGIEDVVALDPETIPVIYMDRSGPKVEREKVNRVLDNPALASVGTVKTKRVYGIKLGEMYCSGVRTIDGIRTFARGMYPGAVLTCRQKMMFRASIWHVSPLRR